MEKTLRLLTLIKSSSFQDEMDQFYADPSNDLRSWQGTHPDTGRTDAIKSRFNSIEGPYAGKHVRGLADARALVASLSPVDFRGGREAWTDQKALELLRPTNNERLYPYIHGHGRRVGDAVPHGPIVNEPDGFNWSKLLAPGLGGLGGYAAGRMASGMFDDDEDSEDPRERARAAAANRRRATMLGLLGAAGGAGLGYAFNPAS